jgi:hypothetical protein
MVLSAITMPANVVLTRLTEIAEGKVSDFLDENKNFDLERAKKEGKDHLLKKVKIERTIRQKKTEVRDDMRQFLAEDEMEDIESEVEIIYEKVEFELHDAHGALRDIGKHHKLFTEKIEHSGGVELAHKQAVDLSKLSDDDLELWEKLLEKANA